MNRLAQSGYTIIEVMIFLAITGVLFASAVVAVGGNQQQAQYSQAVRDFETQIKDIMNDVSNGYYPDYTEGTCESSGSTVVFTTTELGGPGTSNDCINIGKTMMVNLDGDTDNFGVATIVGLSPGLGGEVDLKITSLSPRMAYSESDPAIDLNINKPIRYGAKVTKIANVEFPATTYSSLSFISNFSSADNSSYENGTLSTSVYGLKGSIADAPVINDYNNQIKDLGDPLKQTNIDVNPNNGFYVCLLMTDGRKARVIIGVDGVITATKTEFDLPATGGPC